MNKDALSKTLRSLAGIVPGAGQILCEIIDTVIPNQRIERLSEFTKILTLKLSSIEKEHLYKELKEKEEFIDLFEEGLRQASRALSKERKDYIASLIANSVSLQDISMIETKHILQLLGELNDIEIIWLRFYLVPYTLTKDQEFRNQHHTILSPVRTRISSKEEYKYKLAVENSYIEHLLRLNLLEYEYDDELDLNKEIQAIVKPENYEITDLGTLLLKHIGLV